MMPTMETTAAEFDKEALMYDKRVQDINLSEHKRLQTIFFAFIGLTVGFLNLGIFTGIASYFTAFYVFAIMTKMILSKEGVTTFFKQENEIFSGVMSDFFVF